MSKGLTAAAMVVGAAFFVVTGAWAFVAPHSFFVTVAHYPPYNRHLFHDVGALSLGIGAGLALALTRLRGVVVGLGGAAVAAVLHAVSHWMDRSQGGRTSDPWLLSLFGVVLVAGTLVAWRAGRGRP